MVRAAIAFFLLALVAYALGAYGLAGFSIEIGKILLYVFLFLSVVVGLVALFTGRKNKYL